ncbi:MAG TPA: DUF952 domain-containing protein [Hymenobacter sp.]
MLYRITPPADWQQAQQTGFFASADLITEGFIHSSALSQVTATANLYYAGQTDLLVLEIDEAPLQAAGIKVVQEWAAERGQAFPHIFGSIPVAAITRALHLTLDANGQFSLPEELS